MSLRDKVKTLWSTIPLNVDTITLEFVWNYKQTRSNNRYARSWMNLIMVDYIGVRYSPFMLSLHQVVLITNPVNIVNFLSFIASYYSPWSNLEILV